MSKVNLKEVNYGWIVHVSHIQDFNVKLYPKNKSNSMHKEWVGKDKGVFLLWQNCMDLLYLKIGQQGYIDSNPPCWDLVVIDVHLNM
jgi:hypothetical protein